MGARFAATTLLLCGLGLATACPAHAQTAWMKRHILCTYGSTHTDGYAAPEEVLRTCDRLLDEESESIWATGWQYGRIRALLRLERCDEALEDIDELLEDGETAGGRSMRARVLFDCQQDLAAALVDVGKAIDLDREDTDLRSFRASIYHRLGQLEKAEADYNEGVRIKPGYDSAYYDRASFYADIGNYEAALRDFAKSEELSAGNKDDPSRLASVYNARTLLWRDRGDYDRALAEANRAVQIYGENGLFRANRGEIWRLKGNLTQALADQTHAVKTWSKDAVPLILRGATLRFMGRTRESLQDYDLALRRCPSCLISVAAGRGLTYEKMGDLSRARADFEKAVGAGRGKTLVDLEKSSYDTAVARLAALSSGAPQPTIAALPGATATPHAVPTPAPNMLAAVAAPSEASGRRVALVVGNAGYAVGPTLANPRADAEVVAETLKRVGFTTVTLVRDANRDALADALRAFAEAADGADWAVVYFSGYGLEVAGRNYLLPIDARLASDGDVQSQAVPLEQLTALVGAAGKLGLVVLDASRTNPYLTQMRRTTAVPPPVAAAAGAGPGPSGVACSVERGLGQIDVAQGNGKTLVVYASKHGQTALDGEGRNSPFAVALAQRLGTPGVDVGKVLRLVRDDVMEATGGRQEPFVYGTLAAGSEVFLVAKP